MKKLIACSNLSKSEVLSMKEIVDLPPIIQKWLIQSGAVGRPKTQVGRLEQKALMKLKPNQKKWYPANAIQYTTTNPPSFIWKVKVTMNKLMWFKGRDTFVDGKGTMLIKLNSLFNIVNEQGGKIDEGALQRYLSEIVWFPSTAINSYLTWRELDDFSAEAIMDYQGTTGSVKFFFNENGDFEKLTALRYKGNEPNAKRLEWSIKANAHRIFEGIKIPSKFQVTWKLEEGEWTWLEMEVVNVQYNENAHPIVD